MAGFAAVWRDLACWWKMVGLGSLGGIVLVGWIWPFGGPGGILSSLWDLAFWRDFGFERGLAGFGFMADFGEFCFRKSPAHSPGRRCTEPPARTPPETAHDRGTNCVFRWFSGVVVSRPALWPQGWGFESRSRPHMRTHACVHACTHRGRTVAPPWPRRGRCRCKCLPKFIAPRWRLAQKVALSGKLRIGHHGGDSAVGSA